MKVKDLIKELSALDGEYDILADFYDKENDIEYEFDFKEEIVRIQYESKRIFRTVC